MRLGISISEVRKSGMVKEHLDNQGEFSFSNVVRLAIMMFLQFFIWGAWYVTAPKFLGQIGFGGPDFGWTYSVGPIAGMISPFFVGMIADRYFSTERVLAAMHIMGGGIMLASTFFMNSGTSPALINLLFFAHMLCFFPTLALTNSLSMHNLKNSEKEFPYVRVFGTIGWIVAGIVIAFTKWDSSVNMFYLAGGAAILLGIYSLTLPHTPPASAGKSVSFSEIAGLGALKLLAKPSFLIFILCSFAICIPLAFYYQLAERAVTQAGLSDPAFKMTFGQMSEIIFMVVMPLFFALLGVKWMLAVGMLAWVIRYALFAMGAPVTDGSGVAWMMLGGIILHGICYDFFFVTGQIYTDKAATPQIRGQAQGLLVFFTLGLGMFIGAQVAGQIEKIYTPSESVQYSEQVTALSSEIEALQEQEQTDQTKTEIAEKEDEKADLQMKALQTMNWQMIWAIPAVASLVVLVIFMLVFRDDSKNVAKAIE